MKKTILIALVLILTAAWMPAEKMRLIPYPKSLQSTEGDLTLPAPLRVAIASRAEEDRFAAAQLSGAARIRVSTHAPKHGEILIGRAGDHAIDEAVARRKLDRAALGKPEGYVLQVDSSGVLIAGADAAGVLYGVETLRQLAHSDGSSLRIPYVTIADWPSLRYRGLSIDISRGPVLTEEQMKSAIRTLAEFKMNLLTLYMEHVFPYKASPLVAPEGTGITPALMTSVSEYARQYHVDLVPQQQTFGHLHYMLKYDLYADMAELPYGNVLAAENERAYDWIRRAATEITAAMPSPFLHIGSDETAELGQGASRALAERIGVGNVYIHHLRRVDEILKPLHRRLMFWGDIALNHPELMAKLPKDLVAMTWTYDPRPDFSSYITPFRQNGMEVFVCPGLNNWSRIFPNVDSEVGNINVFVRDGKKLGAEGMLNTHWNDDGESSFNLNWYGIAFSAAAAWQPDLVDVSQFNRAFDWVFYRNPNARIFGVIDRFARIERMLHDAGLRDASDSLFWLDPFSRDGAQTVAKAAPIAVELRKLAEQNIVDLDAIDAKTLDHGNTIPYLKLAARRLDYFGMKVEFSKLIAAHYRDAQANAQNAGRVRRDLHGISSANGLIQDLRDTIVALRVSYREAWLAEYQPYWLGNVMLRYDTEALHWQRMSRLIENTLSGYAGSKTLPDPQKLGLTLPE